MRYKILTSIILGISASSCLYSDEYDYQYQYQSDCECDEDDPALISLNKANVIAIAPEFSWLKRKREGGTSQDGPLYGIRVQYDHIKRYKFYWGVQGYYASGSVDGHTGNDSKIKSRWTDEMIEGNFGYTFQYKYCPHYSFTPFVGAGYFRETNKFGDPSPIHLKFITQLPYISYGFLSSITFRNCFSIGVNARFRTPWEVKCHVKDDPDFDTIKLNVGEELQYRIELPLYYRQALFCSFFELGLVPFYEKRAYGGRENYPFNFFETHVTLYGFNIQLLIRF